MNFRHVLILALLFSGIYPATASHFCTIVSANQNCPANTYLTYTSYNYTNSHINIPSSDAENYKQCCSFIPQSIAIAANTPGSCASQGYTAELFDYYQATDSHVARNGSLTTSDNFRLCANNSANRIECVYESDRTPPIGFVPVIYLPQPTDAHIEMANLSTIGKSADTAFSNTVSCKLTPTAPLLESVVGVSTTALRISVRDMYNDEDLFLYYGNLNSFAGTYIANNTTTSRVAVNANSYHYTWTGLSVNQSYAIRSKILDSDGTYSDYSNEIKRFTLSSTPQNIRANPKNDTTLNISWNANGNPAGTIYTVFWGNLNESTDINNVLCMTTNNWCTQTGLNPDNQYCYKSRSMNGDGLYSSNSSSNCNSTSFTFAYGTNSHFDPAAMNLPDSGFVKTYLFIRNDGNVPDRYSVTFAPGNGISVNPENAFVDVPAHSWERIEITVYDDGIDSSSTLEAIVESLGSGNVYGAQFTANGFEIISVPGIDTLGVGLLAILGALVLLI